MIRHIQAALNYSDKHVYALYLVDSECGYTSDLTKEALDMHPQKEKQKIRVTFYGYTTWQRIASACPEIKYLTRQEIDMKQK